MTCQKQKPWIFGYHAMPKSNADKMVGWQKPPHSFREGLEMNVHTPDVYGFVRVSTYKQDVEHQIQKIKEHYPHVKDFFIEDGVSGALPRSQRPIFQKAIATCKKEKALLVCTRLDRLGRNAPDVLDFFQNEIQKGKVNVEVIGLPLDPMTTPIMVGVGSIERHLISERTKDALARIKAEIRDKGFYITKDGKKITSLGSPTDLSKASAKGLATRRAKADLYAEAKLPLIISLQEQGMSLRGIANRLNELGERTIRGNDFNAQQVKLILGRG